MRKKIIQNMIWICTYVYAYKNKNQSLKTHCHQATFIDIKLYSFNNLKRESIELIFGFCTIV